MTVLQKAKNIVIQVIHFVTDEVWSVRLDSYPKSIAMLLKYLRVILVSVRRFSEDRVQLRASSLTYYTMLAIVPILAMGFGIAKGFGFDKFLEQKLVETFEEQQEVLNFLIQFAHSMLENTKGGVVAGVGVAVLFWSVMKMMGNIERSLNDIWQVKSGRAFVRQFTDYISVMLVAPILILLSNSGKVYVATQLGSITANIELIDLDPVVMLIMKGISIVITWVIFMLLYIIMPNAKVKWKSALLAGIVAGTAFLFTKWLYIVAQTGMSSYNVVYGSFAALPLLLVWMRTSWLIFLLGAELSFAEQNIDQYELENESLHISAFAHRAYNLYILERIVRRFADGEKPITAQDMATTLQLPIRLVRSVISDLLGSELISQVYTSSEKSRAYAPAKDIRKYTVKYVVETLDKRGINRVLDIPADGLKKAFHIQEHFFKMMAEMPDNILIQDFPSYQIVEPIEDEAV